MQSKTGTNRNNIGVVKSHFFQKMDYFSTQQRQIFNTKCQIFLNFNDLWKKKYDFY